LDAGNALWSNQQPAAETEGKLVVEAMNVMGYDAMVIGDLDLQLAPDVLRQRIADAQFPILSANLKTPADDKLLAQPYVLLDVGGRTAGIIGLTWDSAAVSADQYVLLNAEEVLAQYARELQEQTDIIIVLSNMGAEEDMRLSSQVSGIDLIVGGRSREAMPQGWRNEQTGTILVQAGAQGQWVGRRQLHIDSEGTVTDYSDELLLLTDEYADDPQIRSLLDSYAVQ
jgi:2',3'-cyclic-nucleotide 2'-phosphodiesterase (5'-nucleotidase family)